MHPPWSGTACPRAEPTRHSLRSVLPAGSPADPAGPRTGPGRWPVPGALRVAVGVAGGVAALEPDLVHAAPAERIAFEEEALVEADAATLADVQLGHPRAHAAGVELLVPGAVQGVGEVHALAVPADLHHLRAAGQWLVRPGGVRGPAHDAADPHRARLARVDRVGDVVLLELTGAPAGHVQVPVVHGQGQVGDQRGNRAERLQRRG